MLRTLHHALVRTSSPFSCTAVWRRFEWTVDVTAASVCVCLVCTCPCACVCVCVQLQDDAARRRLALASRKFERQRRLSVSPGRGGRREGRPQRGVGGRCGSGPGVPQSCCTVRRVGGGFTLQTDESGRLAALQRIRQRRREFGIPSAQGRGGRLERSSQSRHKGLKWADRGRASTSRSRGRSWSRSRSRGRSRSRSRSRSNHDHTPNRSITHERSRAHADAWSPRAADGCYGVLLPTHPVSGGSDTDGTWDPEDVWCGHGASPPPPLRGSHSVRSSDGSWQRDAAHASRPLLAVSGPLSTYETTLMDGDGTPAAGADAAVGTRRHQSFRGSTSFLSAGRVAPPVPPVAAAVHIGARSHSAVRARPHASSHGGAHTTAARVARQRAAAPAPVPVPLLSVHPEHTMHAAAVHVSHSHVPTARPGNRGVPPLSQRSGRPVMVVGPAVPAVDTFQPRILYVAPPADWATPPAAVHSRPPPSQAVLEVAVQTEPAACAGAEDGSASGPPRVGPPPPAAEPPAAEPPAVEPPAAASPTPAPTASPATSTPASPTKQAPAQPLTTPEQHGGTGGRQPAPPTPSLEALDATQPAIRALMATLEEERQELEAALSVK